MAMLAVVEKNLNEVSLLVSQTLQKIEVERRPLFAQMLGVESRSKFDKKDYWHELSSTL